MTEEQSENLEPLVAVPLKNRLTYLVTVHHEQHGDKITTVGPYSLARQLDTLDEPYSRRLAVTEDFKAIDFGWLENNVGLLVIENLKPIHQLNPSEAVRKADDAKIVEVVTTPMYDPEVARLVCHPGSWPIIVQVDNPTLLRIRCQSGQTFCRLTAFPKSHHA